MTSVDSKTLSGVIQNLDRISELPEPMILEILSRLPLEDSARASILSKTWKSYCALHPIGPILYYDHNLFALQSLVGGDEPDINQIRDTFLDDVHNRLSRAGQLDSPIRKLALNVAINDSKCFSRLDTCLELVRRINVQDLCVSLQTVGYLWKDKFCDDDDIYEFPISVLASKGLRSVYIRGCMFSEEVFVSDPISKTSLSFSSLQRLCLSHVYIKDHAFENLVNYCPGIETLVFDSCTVLMDSIQLSRFPKLKNAHIEFQLGIINHVGIVDTNLESFKCTMSVETECHINPAACASIRELTLLGCTCTINQPSVFADLAATFPLVEEADIYIHDTETFKAVSNVLRKLKFYKYGSVPVKEVHVDCPRLTSLDCISYGLVQVYVDCPKLRVFRYKGNTVPKRLFFSPVTDLEESRFQIYVNHPYDTLWFINLRAFLVRAMANPTYLILTFTLPMATFEPEQVEAFHASLQYNIHLTVWVTRGVGENVATLVDAVLWIIRPTTLVVGCGFYHLLKYLCENLIKKSQVEICDEQTDYPCWMHHLEDFRVGSSLDIPDIKENLVNLAERCRTFSNHIYFKFRWSN